MNWKTITLALSVAVAALAAGQGYAQTRGGDVVIAMVQAPPSLDAHVTSAQVARNVNLHIYETLYARDENASPVPDLAQGVTISPDGKTYVFKLREGVKFHNGKEMKAQMTQPPRSSATARWEPPRNFSRRSTPSPLRDRMNSPSN
jgi:peptide/nickel transport system substrate-binding protein